MATVIEELGQLLSRAKGIQVTYQAADMLVTMSVGNGRKQTVMVTTQRGHHGAYSLIRLRSRVSAIAEPKMVRDALRANTGLSLGGLALDTSTSPPALDMIYSIIADNMNINTFVSALQRVARRADDLERRLCGTDQF